MLRIFSIDKGTYIWLTHCDITPSRRMLAPLNRSHRTFSSTAKVYLRSPVETNYVAAARHRNLMTFSLISVKRYFITRKLTHSVSRMSGIHLKKYWLDGIKLKPHVNQIFRAHCDGRGKDSGRESHSPPLACPSEMRLSSPESWVHPPPGLSVSPDPALITHTG